MAIIVAMVLSGIVVYTVILLEKSRPSVAATSSSALATGCVITSLLIQHLFRIIG